jgi:ubiquinone/menaquinone biosynthesis C-methylase UbiE
VKKFDVIEGFSRPDVYDLLYSEKDYKKEVDYVSSLLDLDKDGTKKILEIGCGTGNHTVHLSKYYEVLAIDKSEKMIEAAEEKIIESGSDDNTVTLYNGGLESLLRAKRDSRFDGAVALFDVVSYSPSIIDYVTSLLKPEAKFVFDAYYLNALEANYYSYEDTINGIERTCIASINMEKLYLSYLYKYDGETWAEQHDLQAFSKEGLKRWLNRAGFVNHKLGVWYDINKNAAIRDVHMLVKTEKPHDGYGRNDIEQCGSEYPSRIRPLDIDVDFGQWREAEIFRDLDELVRRANEA